MITKEQLIVALQENTSPDNAPVLVSVKKYFDGEPTWDEINGIDPDGEPILISLGDTVME